MTREGSIWTLLIAAAGALLMAFSPDALSLLFVCLMMAMVLGGFWIGLVPAMRFTNAFRRAGGNIEKAMTVQADDPWLVVKENRELFGNVLLDERFRKFVFRQEHAGDSGRKAGIADPADYLNDAFLNNKTADRVLVQIPGTLTGLGILGTFLGLLLGLRQTVFSSGESTRSSISLLLGGVRLAFYTSIAGVLLSILFTLMTVLLKRSLQDEKEQFFLDFHHYIIPSPQQQLEEQELLFEQKVLDGLREISGRGGDRADGI